MNPHRRGFTLIELLSAMAILAILWTIAATAYRHWGRQQAIDSAGATTVSALNLARQWAITHHTSTQVQFGKTGQPSRGFTVVSDSKGNRLSETNRFAAGILFEPQTGLVTFRPAGTCDLTWTTNQPAFLAVQESPARNRPLATTITVFRATGYVTLHYN
jgi:prepilin-type N-terminal cleavage/methylation domain-containing protein